MTEASPDEPGRPPTEVRPAPVVSSGQRVHIASPYRFGFFGCLGVLTAYLLFQAALEVSTILLTVVVALLVAVGLNPVVEVMTRRGLPRVLAVLGVFLALAAFLTLVVLAVLPVFTQQINLLLETAPESLVRMRDNPVFADLDARYQIVTRVTDFITSGDLIQALFGGLLGAGRFIANVLVAGIVTLVLTLYFMSSLPAIKQVIYRLSPASQRPRVRYLADQIFGKVGSYLTGMFVVVTCAGVLSFVFLSIIGMGEYALAVAAVVSILSFIPLVGSTLSMVLVTAVCLSSSVPQGVAGLVYYLVYQQFEAYVIYPRVMARSVQVPGPVTVIAALAFGTLLGIVGALIAVPTAAALLILYREVLIPRLDRS
ncbi:AI-2E family transporter [Auraticoccus monumenti]|uniref:Predicted PurR-regulated permease PerM n=1 Tax=Auraticoccus monumenti TaxID=675864 RepID=A0A1G7AZA7_9ACTN|nr:AI-2E family transporter [Auraticoccus monumenti]SDE20159.1 Predicted PurR-regulated permease PerM [Auraticoccus monumenti]